MSIKVCIISPASHLEQFSSLGDCEMSLSHLVVQDAGFHHSDYVKQNYVKYYKQKAAEGKWVILDNSAYEIGRLESNNATGRGLGPDIVLKAAEIIKPSIVIAQDVLCDREATKQSTLDFIKYVKQKGLFGKFQLMGVAQGKTQDEWLESYTDLYNMPEINQIGFSKVSVPLCFGGNQQTSGCIAEARLKCTQIVDTNFKYSRYDTQFGEKFSLHSILGPKPAHLLGGDNHLPWELSQQRKYQWIFSNDSSAVVQYGIHNQMFAATTGQIENIITAKPDLENNNLHTAFLLETYSNHILHNIATLHKMSK